MGLAPLNAPAQHARKRSGTKVPGSLCAAGLPQSPSRIKAFRGVLSAPGEGSPVAETSPPNNFNVLFSNGTDLNSDYAAAVVKDIIRDQPEEVSPPTPALYYNGGVLPQPLPDAALKEENFGQLVSELHRMSMANTEVEDRSGQKSEGAAAKGPRRFAVGVLLGLAAFGVAGFVSLVVSRTADEDASKEK